MNKKRSQSKRILALLCAIAMVVTLFPAGIFQNGAYAVDEDATEAVAAETPAAEQSEQPAASDAELTEENAAPADKAEPEKEEASETPADSEKKEEPAPAKSDTPDKKADADKSQVTDADKPADKEENEKQEDSEEPELFEASFDLTDNYAHFNPINAKKADENGKIQLPKNPEARKTQYKAWDGKEYYFTGWELNGTEYEPGNFVTLKKDSKFKAVWKQTYTIEFSTKGIKADNVEDQVEVFDEPVVLPNETASKAGLDFIGWTPDNGKTVYGADTKIAASKIQPKRSVGKIKLMAENGDLTKPAINIELVKVIVSDGEVTGARYKITATDNGSGMKSIEYLITDKEDVSTLPEEENWWTIVDDPSAGGECTVPAGKYLHVEAVDNDNNSATDKIKVDADSIETNRPVLSIADDEKTKAAELASTHTIQFMAADNDPVDPDMQSGLNYIHVFSDDEDKSIDKVIEASELDEDGKGEITLKDLDGEFEVHFVAYDNCGNTSDEVFVTCKFDNTAPVIEKVELTGGNEFDGKFYYGKTGTNISITASDETELATLVVFIGGVQFEAVTSGTEGSAEISSDELYGRLCEDGDIESELTMTIMATDIAGNKGELTTDAVNGAQLKDGNVVFTYDTIAPKLVNVTTSPSGEGPFDGDYYYQMASTKYEIEEGNLESATLSYNGTTEQFKDLIIEKSWSPDGAYKDIKISATDKAGNKLVNDYNGDTDDKAGDALDGTISFNFGKVIDSTPPEVTVTYSSDATPYLYGDTVFVNNAVSFTAEIADNNDLNVEEIKELFVQNVNDSEVPLQVGEKTTLFEKVDDEEGASYKYEIKGTDRAGNQAVITEKMDNVEVKDGKWVAGKQNETKILFVLDTKAPTYTSSDFTEVSDNASPDGTTAYYNTSIKGVFTVDDKNFDSLRVKAGYVQGEGDGYYSAISPAWSNSLKGGTVSGNTYTVEASEQGVYRFEIYGEDKAGNSLVKNADVAKSGENTPAEEYNETEANNEQKGQFWSYIKVIDTEAPEATLTVDDYYKLIIKMTSDDGLQKNLEKYEPFRKEKSATIDIETEDKSPVSISYKIRYNKKSDSVTAGSWANKKAYGDADFYTDDNNCSGRISGEIQFEIIDLKIIDRAGNETAIDKTNIIYLDGTKPDPSIDVVKPQPTITATTKVTARGPNGQNLYNKSVQLKFSVKDPNAYKSSSGLKSVKYIIYVDGTKVDDVTLKEWTPLTGKPETGKNPSLDYTYTKNITLEKGGKYESNRIKVVLDAEDNAGNKDDASLLLGIDSVGPQITVSYDNNSVQNEKYFKANRTATIKVKERNLGASSKKITIKTEPNVSGTWSYSAGGAASGNNDVWTKRVAYTKDGDYTMTVSGTDALGNPAKVTYTGAANRKFTIDKTAPVIRVTFDNNNVRNGKYYRANRTATITINEHNYRDSDVKLTTKATGPRGGSLAFPARSGVSSSGDTRTSRIPFTREGSYSFNVNYTDLAGNPAKVVKINEFVIDKTAPTVRIENVINGGIYGGTVAPRAVFDDDTFSRSDSSFRFTGISNSEAASLVPGFSSNGEYGGAYIMNDFPYYRIYDDVYTAYATSTDMAGNSTTVQVTFSVNRFGSTYDYNNDNATESLVGKSGRYYTNEPQDLQIREFNVNHIKSYSLTLDRGGNTIKLKEGKDYTVVKSESEDGTRYTYKINKSIITDEGNYNVIVRSEDEAGNVNTNAAIRNSNKDEDMSEWPLRFVYDTTKPVITLIDPTNADNVIELKNSPYYGIPALDLGIRPEDDRAIGGHIKLVLTDENGEHTEEYTGEEYWKIMEENGNFFPETISSGHGTKHLVVTIWDAAGNETTEEYDITVLNGPADVARHYWYWILLALAAASGGYAYYRHRKNDDDDDEEEEEDVA